MQNPQDKFEEVGNCLYCNSQNISYLYSAPDRFSDNQKEKFGISKCLNCGLVFQSPRIKEHFIGDYYQDNLGYYQIPSSKNRNFISRVKKFLEKQTLIEYFNYRHLGSRKPILYPFLYPFKHWQKTKLVPNFTPSGKVLEIGCSHGDNMRFLRSIGWTVVGQEFSLKMAEHARQSGFEVFTGRVEDMNFLPESFDVIVASMVLEHVYDPFSVMNQLTKWLKSGGQLVFSIPYFESLEFYFFKEYSYGLHLPRHITFLNKNIITEYLSKIGYKDIKFHFQFFDRDIVSSSEYKYASTNKYFYRLLHKNKFVRYLLIKPSLFILSLFGKTSRVTVCARKR